MQSSSEGTATLMLGEGLHDAAGAVMCLFLPPGLGASP
jgi:hypothetical protein